MILALLWGCGSPDCLLVRVDGADLPVCVEGDLDSPEILLHLAGGPSKEAGWLYTNSGLRPVLHERFAVARYDYRGFGAAKGSYSTTEVTMAKLGEDTNEVIRALRIRYADKEIWIHGHSFGGSLGTATLLDPNAEPDGWISEAGCHDGILSAQTSLERIPAHDASGLSSEVQDRWDQIRVEMDGLDPTNVFDSATINGYANEVDSYLDVEYADNRLQSTFAYGLGMPFQLAQVGFPASVANGLLSQDHHLQDYQSRMAEIDVPSLYLVGDLDFICTAEVSQLAHDALSSSRKAVHVFEDAGHNFGDQYPEEVADVIEAFVRP